MIARGGDWSLAEYVCSCGPGDRPFEEKHEHFTIAAVVEGAFTYKCDSGRALLHPGAVLLGNFGQCFECGHDHSRGDRCVAMHLAPSLFAEIAATVAGTGRFHFSAAMAPAAPILTGVIAELDAASFGRDKRQIEEETIRIAEKTLAIASGHTGSRAQVSARDERRISETLHYIEDNAESFIDLAGLAKLANMSKFHFLRVFRATIGASPYQYLLNLRMRRAAVRLIVSAEPISAIAFGVGFGDLSTFNSRFLDQFGISPREYRRRQTPVRSPCEGTS